MTTPLMKCGHAAQGKDMKGNPVCVICVGSNPNARIIDDNPPNLEGRVAECSYCSNKADSDFNLPFFSYRPQQDRDSFYCGCFGWD